MPRDAGDGDLGPGMGDGFPDAASMPGDAGSSPEDVGAGAPDAASDASLADVVEGAFEARRCETTFRFVPDGPTPQQVQVAGEWDWSDLQEMRFEEGAFVASRALGPGLHCYKLIVDGQWRLDPGQRVQAYCDGVLNSGVRGVDCDSPEVKVSDAPRASADGFEAWLRFLTNAQGDAPGELEVSLLHNFAVSPVEAAWDSTGRLRVALSGLAPGKYTLRVDAADVQGNQAERVLLPFWVEAEPFVWRDALIYMIMTDRFVNGDPSNDAPPTPMAEPSTDWEGGDFAGVTQMIESGYFDELGVRALWLTPFNQGTDGVFVASDNVHQVTGFHGYWPVAPRAVDRRLGTEQDLEAMVAAAHRRGIRILMDAVINHVHEEHSTFEAHPAWFNPGCVCGSSGCDWTDERLTCLFADYMPDIDWKNKDAGEHFIKDVLWWLERYDLDGARVDAVKHVDDLAVFNLVERVNHTFERGGTDYFLDGETAMGWAGDDLAANDEEYGTINRYMGPGGLDGQFDFVLYHAVVENVFFRDRKGYVHLDFWTGQSQRAYLPGSVMTPYIGSHDTSRVLSLADYRGQDDAHPVSVGAHKWASQGLPVRPDEREPYDRVGMAMCWLLTIPGAPMVYQGDEYGEFGGGDPDNRHPFRAEGELVEREAALLSRVRALGSARARLSPLRRGDYRSLGASERSVAFARVESGASAVVVVLNGDAAPLTRTLDLAGLGFGAGAFDDELGLDGALVVDGDEGRVTLPAHSCAVFSP